MTRVDEALRRAAADTAGVEVPETTATTMVADDATMRAAEESFPVEIPDRRRRSEPATHAPAHAATAVAPQLRVLHGHQPVPKPEEARSSEPLFTRLHEGVGSKTVIDQNTSAVSREQYRRLAASLHHHQMATGMKVVLVTSASVGEGKTLTAANLALTFSESYQKHVLLIDADLRRPALNRIFRIANGPGLSDGLMAADNRTLPVHEVSPRLAILSAGRPSSDPIAGLTSTRMQRVIQEAREAFDWVIVDTPPVALLPDANLLAGMVDGAVLVINANATSYRFVQRAIDALGRDKILGTVLNRANSPKSSGDDEYYGYYYGPDDEDGANGAS
jgi:protein-tyrosine kinase